MLRQYAEKILEMYENVDDIMIISSQGKIEFYKSYHPEMNIFRRDNIVGRDFLQVFPYYTLENSTVLQVLKTGVPIMNQRQVIESYTGKKQDSICSTLPIKLNDQIIGVADIARYIDGNKAGGNDTLQLKSRHKTIEKTPLFTLNHIITQDKNMEKILELIGRVAKTESSVMIYGNTGTGKELVAQALHSHSNRRSAPFVSQNCAAIPATLLEALLFGTVKGSFTGAEDRKGLFELADGGTLFLDEINSMELSVQGKILRAVEMGEITRVGGTLPIPVNIRFLSALNQEPLEALTQKQLREDLYYRLSVVKIHLPPLKARKGDIPLLTEHFIKTFNKKMKRNIRGVTFDVEEIFARYSWPGNVRELRNAIESAFNICDSQLIKKEDIQEYLTSSAASSSLASLTDTDGSGPETSLQDKVNAYERQLILNALNQSQSKAEAARSLKVSKQTLNYKMEKLGVRFVSSYYT